MHVRDQFILISLIIVGIITAVSLLVHPVWWLFFIFGPLIIVGIYDMIQYKHSIRRNFPVIGHLRYLLEKIRPEIMQYFVETDTQGRPFHRIYRSLIYQRAKNISDTTPFGTQMDVYKTGYEWIEHSMYAIHKKEMQLYPRITIGGADCKQPYSASLLNISAMSYGSLSSNAVEAMNRGARIGGFAQNTGEGGVSPYHLKHGGDLIWQVGTGYFGCRADDGTFSEEKYVKTVSHPNIKMVELKLSQGAKPGHGGILPAKKNTEEIAQIRGVKAFTAVHSPPAHSAFSNAVEFCYFIKKLRDLSDGKPIGFKLCVGKAREFIDICEAMIKTGIKPDFISVDGGEGGTGAAPVEFSNAIGMPLREGLAFVYDTLVGYDLKKDIKVIASGKIVSGFHMVRAMALGADLCYSARAMMMAVGCIQALLCNTNTCPVGVATQDQKLMKGLVIPDKAKRIAHFHDETIESFVELVVATGIGDHKNIGRDLVNRRMNHVKVMKYSEIYPYLEPGCLLKPETRPESYKVYYS